MGMVNRVVPHAELEATALDWGRRIVAKSPTAQRMLKYSFNLIDDGLVGQQLFAGETTRLAYMAEEARSEEHTSELQSRQYLVCRLLLEKKKKNYSATHSAYQCTH